MKLNSIIFVCGTLAIVNLSFGILPGTSYWHWVCFGLCIYVGGLTIVIKNMKG